jgi:threonine dehydrogenase-like Zn-dependent dehydrogenase
MVVTNVERPGSAARGVDVAIEAVGVPATFDICHDTVTAGGYIANIGVHGHSGEFHIERLWAHNFTLTTRLVDTETVPVLLKMVAAGKIDANALISLISSWETSRTPTRRFAMLPRRTSARSSWGA